MALEKSQVGIPIQFFLIQKIVLAIVGELKLVLDFKIETANG